MQSPEITLATDLSNFAAAAALPSDQELPVNTTEDGKVNAATQQQQDQLASFAAQMGAPVPEQHAADVQVPNMEKPEMPESAESYEIGAGTDKAFRGFSLPAGPDRMLLILHPEKDEHGEVGTPPQLLVALDNNDWQTWARDAIRYGLTKGSVEDAEGTNMTGFSATVLDNEGNSHNLAFLFTQIASAIPFRDVWQNSVKGQENRALKADAVRRAKAKRRKANKQASKQRRQK